jgi:hypothetical protein
MITGYKNRGSIILPNNDDSARFRGSYIENIFQLNSILIDELMSLSLIACDFVIAEIINPILIKFQLCYGVRKSW